MKAAKQGHINAQYNVGRCYEKGHGTTQNFSEAIKWYRKSAEAGNASAQYTMARCYEKGIGVHPDGNKMLLWVTKAANQGLPEALYDLARIYFYGGAGEKREEAINILKRLSIEGYPDATEFLIKRGIYY